MTETKEQNKIEMIHGRAVTNLKGNKKALEICDKIFNGTDDKHKVIVLKDSEPESDIDRLTMMLLRQSGILDNINNSSR